MNYKVILKSSLPFIIFIIIYLFIVSILSYFNIISYKLVSVLSYIFSTLLFLLSGFKIARNTSKRGYLTGLITGISLVLLMIILSLIFKEGLKLKALIYYGTLILSSIIGGMTGINTKKDS